MTRKLKLLLIFFAMVGIGFISLVTFILITLRQIPLDGIQAVLTQSITTQSIKNENAGTSKLEAGSLVRAKDLKTFVNLSLNPLRNIQTQAVSEQERGILAIDSDLVLDPPHSNDCKEIYCIQTRRPFREIPSTIWRGLIGIEDIRFLGHSGFDVRAIARALVRDVIEMGFVEGGSTITQQLAKNLFFTNEKNILRKLKELIIAVAIEEQFDKDEIIQAYLNEVYWGVLQGVRVKGFHAASILYFDKSPREIDPFEAVILVSLLKGPGYYHPIRHLDRLQARVESVLSVLIEKKVLDSSVKPWSEKQWNQWQKSLIENELEKNRPLYAWWSSTRVEAGVLQAFDKYVFVKSVHEVLAAAKQRAPGKDLAAKVLVRSWDKKDSPFEYYSKIERDVSVGLNDERHQVGSTLKPLIYSMLVRMGVELDRPVDTSEIELKLKSGNWSPAESHQVDEAYLSFSEALRQSLNRPLIRMAQEVGFEELETELNKLIPNLKSPLAQYPAQLLGAVELSVSELAQSYQDFFDKECSPEGSGVINVLDDPKQTTIKRVVGKVMSQMRFFGKTGTTNGGRDNWFVFFDGKVISVIWVGQETARDGEGLPLYGSSTSFKILETYLLYRGKLFNDLHCATLQNEPAPLDSAI